MNYEELYNEIHKTLFAALWELQNTNPNEHLKIDLQARLDVCYKLIGESLDEEWYKQIDEALSR